MSDLNVNNVTPNSRQTLFTENDTHAHQTYTSKSEYQCLLESYANAMRQCSKLFWNNLTSCDSNLIHGAFSDIFINNDKTCDAIFILLKIGKSCPDALRLKELDQKLMFSLHGHFTPYIHHSSADTFRLVVTNNSFGKTPLTYAPYRIISILKSNGYPEAQLYSTPINNTAEPMNTLNMQISFSLSRTCIMVERENSILTVKEQNMWKRRLIRAVCGKSVNRCSILQNLKHDYNEKYASEIIYQILFEIALNSLEVDNLEHTIDMLITAAASNENKFAIINNMLHILSTHLEESPNSSAEIIKQATAFMRKHLDKSISLKDTAEYVGLNEFYFSHLFTKFTGMSYVKYLTMLRIDRAKNLLETIDLPLHELSILCGYHSASYFCSIFKKQTGITPGEYKHTFCHHKHHSVL